MSAFLVVWFSCVFFNVRILHSCLCFILVCAHACTQCVYQSLFYHSRTGELASWRVGLSCHKSRTLEPKIMNNRNSNHNSNNQNNPAHLAYVYIVVKPNGCNYAKWVCFNNEEEKQAWHRMRDGIARSNQMIVDCRDNLSQEELFLRLRAWLSLCYAMCSQFGHDRVPSSSI